MSTSYGVRMLARSAIRNRMRHRAAGRAVTTPAVFAAHLVALMEESAQAGPWAYTPEDTKAVLDDFARHLIRESRP